MRLLGVLLVALLGCSRTASLEVEDPGTPAETGVASDSSSDLGVDTTNDALVDAPPDDPKVHCLDPEAALPAWFKAAPSVELYVSEAGDDANDGSEAKPLRTTAAAFKKLAPGVRLNFKDGRYDCGTIANFPGTATKPGWVRSSGGRATFGCAAGGITLDNVHYLALDSVNVHDSPVDGIRLASGGGPWSTTTISNDVVLHDMTFHGNRFAAFKASQARSVYVIGNQFLRGGSGKSVELVAVDDAVIAGNDLNSTAGLDEIRGGSRNGRIFQNRIGGGAGIFVGGVCTPMTELVDKTVDFAAKDLIVWGNVIEGTDSAFRIVDCKDCLVAHNTFAGRFSDAWMRVMTDGACDSKKLGNANVRVINNIFLSERQPTFGIASNQLPPTYLTMHHNAWFATIGDATAAATDISFKDEPTSLYVDPQLFVDHKPTAGSPVIGKGAALPEACTPGPTNIGAY